jgi:arylsulfatase A-like enzyme
MNVIIVMLDTLRPDYLGCNGNTWIRTPNFDQFAEESMVFDRSVEETLPTLQVRRTMLTGMRIFPYNSPCYSSTGEPLSAGIAAFLDLPRSIMPGWDPIPVDQFSLAQMLQGAGVLFANVDPGAAGYRTALITDTLPYWSPVRMNLTRGFRHWDYIRGQEGDSYGSAVLANRYDLSRYMPQWFQTTWEGMITIQYLACAAKRKSEDDYFGPKVFGAAIEYLEDNREAKDPFFLLVDSWDPHEPWDPPQHYVDLYDPGYDGLEMISPYYGPTKWMSERELNHMRVLYAGEVTMVDTWFGKLMDKVKELGLLDDTLIIVTSDHGHQLGEHGIAGKLPAGMYWELMNSVLMIRHPKGIGAGQRSNALVQHQDICSTVLSCVGVVPPYELDGKDLMPILEGKKDSVRDYATCGFVFNVWACDDEYALICRKDGAEPQLFDMKSDPGQLHNIAADKPKVVKRMFDLVLDDAQGGPILPDWEWDEDEPEALKQVHAWMEWSPFKDWRMPFETT